MSLYRMLIAVALLLPFGGEGFAQEQSEDSLAAETRADSLYKEIGIAGEADSLVEEAGRLLEASADSLQQMQAVLAKSLQWQPDPKKAMWLAIVFPGGGQIYNRKYWKLPLFYGGFIGCIYAMNWNNTMYHDYSQAYIDIMDDDPNTKSYENFLPSSYDVNANMERLQTLFQRKKNYYRRYRDLSIFCMIGVYALSIIDAYVDAELSSFDIGPDLSMKVRPSVFSDRQTAMRPAVNMSNHYGVQCSLTF